MENPYITPARVRAALRALELRPTRGMGQNFLVDPEALAAIVAAAEMTHDDTVVEVGPGLGVLTWELLARAGRVVAVELDKRLVARLHEEFGSEPRLTIIQGDILKLAPEQLLTDQWPTPTLPLDQPSTGRLLGNRTVEGTNDQPAADGDDSRLSYKVVANLPYAITSAALRYFLEARHKPTLIVVLVQWEVAERIVARPGDLSVLAHAIQVYAKPEIVARVPASGFVPAPAVDSAVLRLRVLPRPAVDVDDVERLLRVVKAGFLHSRKKLSNALPGGLAAMGMPVEKERAIAALESAGVDPGRRAEMLTLAEWAAVYRALGVGGQA
jgi:16S rRNA (adenine1518-N6/adenine1519-N6)-dimethyltransferase